MICSLCSRDTSITTGHLDLEAWEILAVEKYYEVDLTDEFKYGMRLDLLVRNRQTGEVSVITTVYLRLLHGQSVTY